MKVTNAHEIVKMLLIKENISVSKLAEMLSTPQKKIYQQTLSAKLIKGTLKVNELIAICNLLNYEIEFTKNKM
jgi:hypothetical protein